MKVWLLIVGLSGSISAFAQSTIRGRISDAQQHLPSVTVLLFSADTTLVKGTATDSLGAFVLEQVIPGDYFLSASITGYSKFLSEKISIGKEPVILPDILLQESAIELGEVIIQSEKPLLEQEIDRLVIHVGDRVASSGNTVLEVLQKLPGVVVSKQNNTISMNSRSGVRIMVNGKLMQVSSDVAIQMLDGMSASNVEKVELITTPPASYDAEGNAGIIHIVTNENLEYGTHGSINVTAGYRWGKAVAGSVSLQRRTQNFAFFLDYSGGRSHNLHIFKMSRTTNNNGVLEKINDFSRRENVTNQHNLSAGAEWKLTDRTTMNILLTAYRRDWKMDANATDTKVPATDSSIVTRMDVREVNLWQSATGSLGLTVAPNLKSKIRFNIDYLFYHNDNPSDYTVVENANQAFKIDLSKTTPIRMVVGTIDHQYNLSPLVTIEAGIKAVTSGLNNNVLVQRNTTGEWNIDPVFTSYSTLKENIAAGYVYTTWKAGQQWQINSGVRYEYTYTLVRTPVEHDLVKRKYGYLFPSFSIKKITGTEKDVQFSYARRITRPTYNDIAPYVFLWSTDAISAGNTSLYPSLTDIASASFHLKQWFVSLQHSHSRNEIAMMQPQFDAQSKTLSLTSQNLEYLNITSLTNSYSLATTGLWEFQTTVTMQYHRSKTAHLTHNLTLEQLGLNLNMLGLLKLPKDFTIEISGMYQSTSLSGSSRFLAFGSLNMGLQKKLGKNGILRASVDDIFGTNNWRIKTRSAENNLSTFFDYYWNNRFVRLSYSFKFGNTKVKSLKVKSASDEERSRVNN
jgi:hypothetical protein